MGSWTIGRAAGAGGLLGGLGGAWMLFCQRLAAWSAGALWFIERPLVDAVLHVATGFLVGAILATLLEILRRYLFPNLSGSALIVACVGLLPYATRTSTTLVMRTRGGLWTLAALSLAMLALCVLTYIMAVKSRSMGSATIARNGLTLCAVTYTAVSLAHLVWRERSVAGRLTSSLFSVLFLAIVGVIGMLLARASQTRRRGERVPVGRHLMSLATVVALLVGIVVVSWSPRTSRAAARTSGPNVLLIVLDTLRRDVVSAYGLIERTTPRLDVLASQGVLWNDAVSTSNWTIPSHASLFTGAPVTRHGAGSGDARLDYRPGGPDTPPLRTIAEIFQAHGWQTEAVVCNGFLGRQFGYDRGFDRYHEVWRARGGDYSLLTELVGTRLGLVSSDRGGAVAVKRLRKFFQQRSGSSNRWFAFVNFLEPHAPYDAPDPWRERFLESGTISRREAREVSAVAIEKQLGGASPETIDRLWRLYLGSVAYQDHLMGQVLDAMDEFGLTDETIVLVTSDHGEDFGWNGHLSHGTGLNDDLIRIPMIARGPGIPEGVVEGSPISLVDVLPTLLSVAGVRTNHQFPGTFVMPPLDIADPEFPRRRPRIVERFPLSRRRLEELEDRYPKEALAWGPGRGALLVEDWKATAADGETAGMLTRRVGAVSPPGSDGRIAIDDPELLARLLAQLNQLRSSWPQATPPDSDSDTRIDSETERQLRALGYIGN